VVRGSQLNCVGVDSAAHVPVVTAWPDLSQIKIAESFHSSLVRTCTCSSRLAPLLPFLHTHCMSPRALCPISCNVSVWCDSSALLPPPAVQCMWPFCLGSLLSSLHRALTLRHGTVAVLRTVRVGQGLAWLHSTSDNIGTVL
jgi:hypothetical protein